jgi:hypothetical protein
MDTYTEHNPLNPINEIEVDAEIVYNEVDILTEQVKIQTQRLDYKIWQLEKLAEIEQCLSVFGTLTHEQLKEKQEILNQYIK